MQIVRAYEVDDQDRRVGLYAIADGRATALVSLYGDNLPALLADEPSWVAARIAAADRLSQAQGDLDAAGLQLLAPVARPGKIVAIGLNYTDHTAETGLAAPAEPLTFAKYGTSLTGPGAEIRVPTQVTKEVDWEAELAVVVGRRCGPDRRGTMADVAGYTVANDVSARDLQFRDGQWTRGKSLDTFCPLGPAIVTADEVADPQALRIWTTVNDETMQDASTADMIFSVAELLDFLTATHTLEPGDLILTGTPPGVGGFRNPPVFLADGDVVTVGVDGIGELSNPVRHV